MHHTWGTSRNRDGDKGVVGTNGRKELPSSELVARPARWSPVSWIPWSSRSRTLWPNLTHASALGMPLLVTSLLVTFGRPRIYSQQLCDSRWTEFRPGVGKNIEQNFPRIESHDNTTHSNHLYFQYILRTHLKLSIDDYKRGSEVKYKYLQLSTARKFQVTINADE